MSVPVTMRGGLFWGAEVPAKVLIDGIRCRASPALLHPAASVAAAANSSDASATHEADPGTERRILALSATDVLLHAGFEGTEPVPKGQTGFDALLQDFVVRAQQHAAAGACGVAHQRVPNVVKSKLELPVEWLLIFIHYACSNAVAVSGKEKGAWAWKRLTRSPECERNMVPFFARLGIDWKVEYLRCSTCLYQLGCVDLEDPSPRRVLVPPLVINTLAPPNEAEIVQALDKLGVKHQSGALSQIAAVVETRLYKLRHRKPGVIMMPGPAATGKTSTAEALIKLLYGEAVWDDPVKRDTIFLQIDLNDYRDEFALNRLVGAEAGLVSSDKQPGTLIRFLQQIEDKHVPDRPISGVMLLDEMDKAGESAKVMQSLMGLMEHGGVFAANLHLTFRATKLIILCAANAGEVQLSIRPPPEQLQPPEDVLAAVKADILSKCCNKQNANWSRFDKVAYYYGFGDSEARDIIQCTLDKNLPQIAADHGGRIRLKYHESLIQHMLAVWKQDGTNARSARNFCLHLEQMAASVARLLQPRLSEGPPLQPLPVLIKCSHDKLYCEDQSPPLLVADAAAAVAAPTEKLCDGFALPTQPLHQFNPGEGLRQTALHDAATEPFSTISPLWAKEKADLPADVQFLLTKANVDLRDRFGRTPLHYAAANSNVNMMRHLLDAGASLWAVDRAGYSALMHAVSGRSLPDGLRRALPSGKSKHLDRVCAALSLLLEWNRPPPLGNMPSPAEMAEGSADDSRDHLDRLLQPKEASGGASLQRTAVLIAYDATEPDSEAQRRIVSSLMLYRAKTKEHQRFANGLALRPMLESEADLALKREIYSCDIDAQGRGLLHRRLAQDHHDQPPSDISMHHPWSHFFVVDPSSAMHPVGGDVDRQWHVLVPVSADGREDLDDLLAPGCAGCVNYVIKALSPQLCVHQHPPLKRALLRVLQKITVRWTGQKIAAEHVAALEAHPVLQEFRKAGVPIDFHLAEAVPFLSHVLPLPEGRQWLLSWSTKAMDFRLGTFPACRNATTPFHSACPLKVGGMFSTPFNLFSQGSFVRTIRFDRSVQGRGAVLQHLQVLRSCMEEYGKLNPTVAARQSLLLGVSPSSASPWMQIYSGLQLVLAWNEQLRRSACAQYEAAVSAQPSPPNAPELAQSLMNPTAKVAQLVSDICTIALQWMLPSHQQYWHSVLTSREELNSSAAVGIDLDDIAADAPAKSSPATYPPRAPPSQINALVNSVIGMRNDVLRQVEEVAGGAPWRNPLPSPAAASNSSSATAAAASASAPALLTSPSAAAADPVPPSAAFPSVSKDRLIEEINKVGANFLNQTRTDLRKAITASLLQERLKFATSTFNGAFNDHTCKYEDKSARTIQKKEHSAEELQLLPLAAAAAVEAEEEEEEEDGSEAGPAAKRRRIGASANTL